MTGPEERPCGDCEGGKRIESRLGLVTWSCPHARRGEAMLFPPGEDRCPWGRQAKLQRKPVDAPERPR